MSKYHDFGEFMDAVIDTANRKVNLAKLFALENLTIIEQITLIIRKAGWNSFVAVVALLLLGPLFFGAAIGSFLVTPPGLIFLAIFGVVAIPTLHALYKDRVLPIAIKDIGEEFKPKWRRVEGDKAKIDDLQMVAAYALIRKASLEQRKLFGLDD